MPSSKIWFDHPLQMTPLVFLVLTIGWVEDLCLCRRPRSTNHYRPRLCIVHGEDLSQCESRRRKQKKTAPRPLPTKRKRALTNPHQLKRWQRTASQSPCRLLTKLPIELRQMIYTYVLKGSTTTLHVVQKANWSPSGQRHMDVHYERHLGFWAGVRSPYDSPFNEAPRQFWFMKSGSGHINPSRLRGSQCMAYGNSLPLLLTCRQIYAEGIDMLYSSHMFSFSGPRLLNVFASTILPQRLHTIRKLHVERSIPYWFANNVNKEVSDCGREEAGLCHTFCGVVNSMLSLQELLIDVFDREKVKRRTSQMEARILQPFMMIRAVEDFVIRVTWDGLGCSDASAPFRIVHANDVTREGER